MITLRAIRSTARRAVDGAARWAMVGALAALPAVAGGNQTPQPTLFDARYQVEWHGFTVGYSDLQLTGDPTSAAYRYVSRSNARGIFRIAFADEITQTSKIAIKNGHAQPESYRADDGSTSTAKSVSLDFDWSTMRARGVSENKPVDLALKPDTQDGMSIQIEIMLDLMNNRPIRSYWVADKDEVKEFLYTNEGASRIKSALGELDTIVLSGRRPGGDRVTRLWFAPSLGFIPVQANRTRNGKVEFAMQIKSLKK